MLASSARLARAPTVAALVVAAALSWWLLARSAAVMSAMSGDGLLLDLAMAMMQPAETMPYLVATALMWAVMMVAMMAPPLIAVLLVFQRLDRRRGGGALEPSLFAGGYVAVWVGFGLGATVLQWGLHRAGLLHDHALRAGPWLAGGILVLAGLYQLTPLKDACLASCQSPLGFLLSHWRDGATGALRMGAAHGVHCLGCCWALMLVMFSAGVMSVAAMAVLSLVILGERLLPGGVLVARVPGIALLAWGAWTWLAAWSS